MIRGHPEIISALLFVSILAAQSQTNSGTGDQHNETTIAINPDRRYGGLDFVGGEGYHSAVNHNVSGNPLYHLILNA
jgi:hypothetical protein